MSNVIGRLLCRVVVFGVCAGWAAVADAGQSLVALGEVTIRPHGAARERDFRTLVENELRALSLPRNAAKGDYVLSAALRRLDSKEADGVVEASCEVSATLRKADGGVLVAMMSGRGTVKDDAVARDDARLEALRAAVRSAVRRVPEAVAK